MNWPDESWIKLYTRDTSTWRSWSWQARALFLFMLRKADRSGIIDIAGSAEVALAMFLDVPEELARDGLGDLVRKDDDGVAPIIVEKGRVIITKFIDAQAARASGKSRMRALRERKRDLDSCDETSRVTLSDARANRVTRDETSPSSSALDGSLDPSNVTKRHGVDEVNTRKDKEGARVTNRRRVTRNGNASRDVLDDVAKRDSTPRWKEVIDHFATRFRSKHGVPLAIASEGRSLKKLAALVRELGADEIIRRINVAFDTPPNWPQGAWDLPMFVQHHGCLVNTNASDVRFGRLEPARVRDGKLPDWEILRRAKEGPMPWDE